MKVAEFGIENFRSIYSLPNLHAQKLNVFIGKNNAGKSAILDALFIALKNISYLSPAISSPILSEPADTCPEQLSKLWFFGGHEKPAIIRIKLELNREEKSELSESSALEDIKYVELEVHITYEENNIEWKLQKLNLVGYSFPSIIQKTNKVYKSITKQDLQEYNIEKIVEDAHVLNNEAFSKFLEISKDKIFRLIPYTYIEEGNTRIKGLLRFLSLPTDMIDCLRRLNDAETELKSKFYNFLQEITPYHTYYIEGRDLLKQWEFITLRTECFGSGEQLIEGLLATLIILSREHQGCIVMIEEPEVHLHPEYVRRLARILRKFLKENDMQLFIVTQSPDFLKEIDWESVFVVRLKKKEVPSLGPKFTTTVDKLGKDKFVAEGLALDLGISVGELAFIDVLILVEGKADEDILRRCIQILSEQGKLQNLNFYSTEFYKIAQLNKDSAIKLATEFLRNQVFVVADGDEEGKRIIETAKKYNLKINENVFQWSAKDILYLFDSNVLSKAIEKVLDKYKSRIKEDNAVDNISELLKGIRNGSTLARDRDPLRDLATIIFQNVEEIKNKYRNGKEREFYYMLKAEIARALVDELSQVPLEIEKVILLIDAVLTRKRERREM